MPSPRWQLVSPVTPAIAFCEKVEEYCRDSDGEWAAQLLWQRGIRTEAELAAFIMPERYEPMGPGAFGQEMYRAVERLWQAREQGERVTIWGDFDADGVTSTAVLWEGLGQFFSQGRQLSYTIPNRLRESHGLNRTGLERLAAEGTKLIVTCDTGSTNLAEIAYARQLGMEVIVTDHHTLPYERPAVVAILNPRYLGADHPLYHLSGVAVAYKLVEALYQVFPTVPQQPLEQLLDLVAIGLIADLVQLTGDCRYLAQRGIQQLKKQKDPSTATRPGVQKLLDYCQKSGDRPTDIGYGIGPRINAISRIRGDASFGVELLTSRDPKISDRLAAETEILNSRRRGLQKTVTAAIQKRLETVDLSTTGVIILEDPQWPTGVLGLAANQIAQEYGRPVVLLNTGDGEMARGSARSVGNIDLYELLSSQRHLLVGFGGHPFAAGLSVAIAQLPLFKEAINQQFWQRYGGQGSLEPVLTVDLRVTVADLGRPLFGELSLLEPCGMGNPVPKLLLEKVTFHDVKTHKMQDRTGQKVDYVMTSFSLTDESTSEKFPGVWWGHPLEDLPKNVPCDVVVELDFNAVQKTYIVRLVAVRPHGVAETRNGAILPLIDRRFLPPVARPPLPAGYPLQTCPTTWSELYQAYQQAIAAQQPLILDYRFVPHPLPDLLELVKHYWQESQRHGKLPTVADLQRQFLFSEGLAQRLVALLSPLAVKPVTKGKQKKPDIPPWPPAIAHQVQALLAEEQFQKRYFSQVPLTPEVLALGAMTSGGIGEGEGRQ